MSARVAVAYRRRPGTLTRRSPLGSSRWATTTSGWWCPSTTRASVIGDVVRDARATFPHVVCVDDGSTDDSAQPARAAGAVVVRHPVNLGQGAALQTGFEYALSTRRSGTSSPSTPTASTRSTTSSRCSTWPPPTTSTSSSAPASSTTAPRRACSRGWSCGRRRLHEPHHGDAAHRRPQRAARAVARRGGPARHHPEPDGARLRASSSRSAPLDVRYAESPVHILYTDYSRSKGQSLWNAVNILADLILR